MRVTKFLLSILAVLLCITGAFAAILTRRDIATICH